MAMSAALAYQILQRTGYTSNEVDSLGHAASITGVSDGGILDATAYTSLVAEYDADKAAATAQKKNGCVREALQVLGGAGAVAAATAEFDWTAQSGWAAS